MWLNDTDKDENNNTTPPKVDFSIGRSSKNNYKIFFTRFVPAVVGPELFQQRLAEKTIDGVPTPLCTVSDEAFALLLLENSYDRWTDLYNKTGEIPLQRRGRQPRTCVSNVAPKYTQGGIMYTTNFEKNKKGWSNDGIQRYNELFRFVQDDRAKYPTFLAKYKSKHCVAKEKPVSVRRAPPTKAIHALWDDQAETTTRKLVEPVPSDTSSDESSSESDAD